MNDTAATLAASLTGAALALFGVSYYALLWGLFGALFGLVLTQAEGRWVAISSVIISALIGAALGEFFSEIIHGGQRGVIALSAICAAGAKPIVTTCISALQVRIEKAGGIKND